MTQTSTPTPPADVAPELDFAVENGGVLEYAATPTLRFDVRITAPPGVTVRSISLHAQIRIAATRRGYDDAAKSRLVDLFGTPERWGTTLHSLLWGHTDTVVTAFEDTTSVDLAMPCTYDFDVVATRYLAGVRDGEIPLDFFFSGTLFHSDENRRLRAARLPWDREASFDLPASTWVELMDHYFPSTAWLRIDRGRFDRLCEFRSRHALPTWDATVDALLGAAGGVREETPR